MPQIGHQTKERACLELVDRLAKLDTIDAVRESVLGILGDYGVEKLIVTHVPAGKDRLRPHVLLEHGWADWLAHYDRHRYFVHDPVGRHCFSTVEPFAWSEAPIDLDIQPLAAARNERQRALASNINCHSRRLDGNEQGGVAVNNKLE